MVIKTIRTVSYPDGGRIVAGVGLRAVITDAGYKVTAYEHQGRIVPLDAAINLNTTEVDDEGRAMRGKKYG